VATRRSGVRIGYGLYSERPDSANPAQNRGPRTRAIAGKKVWPPHQGAHRPAAASFVSRTARIGTARSGSFDQCAVAPVIALLPREVKANVLLVQPVVDTRAV